MCNNCGYIVKLRGNYRKVLYITANKKKRRQLFSMAAGATFIEKYKAVNPSYEVVVLVLFKPNIPFIGKDVFAGCGN